MKKILVTMIVSSAVIGAVNLGVAGGIESKAPNAAGIYFDGGAGYAWNTDKNYITAANPGATSSSASTKGHGFAWTADAGYQLNEYFGLELGYLSLPDSKAGGNTLVHRFDGVDLMLKAIYPFNDGWSAFAKGGVARMSANVGPISTPAAPGVAATSINSQTNVRYTPIFALGSAYNLNSNLAVTMQGTTTLMRNPLPASWMLTGGLSYKFLL